MTKIINKNIKTLFLSYIGYVNRKQLVSNYKKVHPFTKADKFCE